MEKNALRNICECALCPNNDTRYSSLRQHKLCKLEKNVLKCVKMTLANFVQILNITKAANIKMVNEIVMECHKKELTIDALHNKIQ